jgi:hypothetical protein
MLSLPSLTHASTDVLQSFQWRPLRFSARQDSLAAENQPNRFTCCFSPEVLVDELILCRVILSDDLKISEFLMLSLRQVGRERFVFSFFIVLSVFFSRSQDDHSLLASFGSEVFASRGQDMHGFSDSPTLASSELCDWN